MSEGKLTKMPQGKVEYEDAAGKKTTFYPSRWVRLTVNKLTVCHHIDRELDQVSVSTC